MTDSRLQEIDVERVERHALPQHRPRAEPRAEAHDVDLLPDRRAVVRAEQEELDRIRFVPELDAAPQRLGFLLRHAELRRPAGHQMEDDVGRPVQQRSVLSNAEGDEVGTAAAQRSHGVAALAFRLAGAREILTDPAAAARSRPVFELVPDA